MEILFILALGFACKSAWDHVKTTAKDSQAARVKEFTKAHAKAGGKGKPPKRQVRAAARRHALGWWGREVAHGFPVTKTGWLAGWLGNKTDAIHHAARSDEAKTTHAEVQADALAGLPDRKQRLAEAHARRDAILAEHKRQQAGAKGSRKRKTGEAVREAAASVDEVAERRRVREEADGSAKGSAVPPLPSETVRGPYAPRRVETETSDLPEDSELSAWLRPGQRRCGVCDGRGCGVCGGWGSAPPDPDGPRAAPGTICSACGNPGTPDNPVLIDGDTFTHRSHAIEMQRVHAARAASTAGQAFPDASRNPEPIPPSEPEAPKCEECWLPLAGEENDGIVHARCDRLLAADYDATEITDDRDPETVESDLRSRHHCPWQLQASGWDGTARYCGRPIYDSGHPDYPCTFCPEHQCEAAGDDEGAADEHHDYVRRLRDLDNPASSWDEPLPDPSDPTTGGTPMSADTNYGTVLTRAQAFVAQADQDGAAIEARLNQAIADADAMQGAEVDSATLGDQMDLIDRLSAAKTALAAVGEQATTVASGVQQRHGGLDEAHRDAPVVAAHRDFYGE